MAFFMLMIGRRRSSLNGHLPLSDDAWADITRLYRSGMAAVVGGFLALFLSMLLPHGFAPVVFALAVSAMVGGLITYRRGDSRLPGIELDASGRWVSLRGVHPAFAMAVHGTEQAPRHSQHGAS
ncbi:MAG: hypothetical protein GY939_23500 [Actinomycetia bacterium]|nr:hypothetical protein [Actinomycetes bacterium]